MSGEDVGLNRRAFGASAALSLLAAQGAQGARAGVALDPRELKQHPLRVGMSMDAKIDVAD